VGYGDSGGMHHRERRENRSCQSRGQAAAAGVGEKMVAVVRKY